MKKVYGRWAMGMVTDMGKAADPADIYVLFFSADTNFWAILSFHSPNVRLRSDLTSEM